MKQKRSIHTTLEISTITKLKELGNGRLNTGIEEAVRLIKFKELETEKQLMKIAKHIMHEMHEELK